MDLEFFLDLGCCLGSSCSYRSAHLAIALEHGTFLNDQELGLDVADELGRAFEDEFLGAFDVALDASGYDGIRGLDFGFDETGAFDDELAFDVDAAVHGARYADIALTADVALDIDSAADRGDFLFFCCHVFTPSGKKFF